MTDAPPAAPALVPAPPPRPLDGFLAPAPPPVSPALPLPPLIRRGLVEWGNRFKRLTEQRDAWVQGALVGLGLDTQRVRVHVDADRMTYQVTGPLLAPTGVGTAPAASAVLPPFVPPDLPTP